jgi:hypothetical protein
MQIFHPYYKRLIFIIELNDTYYILLVWERVPMRQHWCVRKMVLQNRPTEAEG